MRLAGRCRRCAARAFVAVDARADTDANCASHRVLQHVDNSLAVDNAMRVAQASVLLAQFGVSFDPFAAPSRASPCRRIPRRVSPKLGSDPHARRWARAVIAAHVLDDRFGRRRRLGRAVVRRSAPDACAGIARQHVALQSDVHKRHCRTSSIRASSTRARWSIRSLICSLRTARTREGTRRACRRRAAHADAAGGHAGHHAAHATPAAA
jgi:hypothetical protein